MQIEMTPEQLALVTNMLSQAQKDLHVEMRRTQTTGYKEDLRKKDEMITDLLERLRGAAPGAVPGE